VCGFRRGELFFSADMSDDAELLRRYVEENSETAFTELVRRRIGLVYAIASRRTRDVHRAKDVTQAVFTALAQKAAQLVGHQTLVGWLYRSAHFAASDAVRAARREQRREEDILIMQQLDRHSPEPTWHQLSPVVDDVLSAMPEKDRDAVLLRVVDERSYVEIGRDLGMSENGARMRVERALEKLRQALARRGVTSTATALAMALGQQAGAAVPGTLVTVVAGTAVSATASAGGIPAILVFMSTTKMAMTALGLLAIASVITSVYQTRTAQQAESVLALVVTERDQLRARLSTAESVGNATLRAAAPTHKNSVATRPVSEPAASPVADPALRREAWAATSAINVALESATGKAAFVKQEVLRAEDRFRRLFDEMQLSPEQRESMHQQFKRYAEAKLEYYETVRAAGFGPMNPPQDPKVLLELLRMEDRVDSAFMQDVRRVLGDDGARKFVEYRKLVPAFNVAEQLAGRLHDTGEPLTPSQARGLVEVLQKNPYHASTDDSPGSTLAGEAVALGGARAHSNLVHGDLMMPGLAWNAPITDAALVPMQGILTSVQIAALRELQAQQAAGYRLAPPSAKGATPEEALALYRNSKPLN
jgi:RNA polymerase sigma factor (sigma-70 family)